MVKKRVSVDGYLPVELFLFPDLEYCRKNVPACRGQTSYLHLTRCGDVPVNLQVFDALAFMVKKASYLGPSILSFACTHPVCVHGQFSFSVPGHHDRAG